MAEAIWVDSQPGPRGVTGVAPKQESFDGLLGAAFRSSNEVVSIVNAIANSGPFAPVEGYSALPDIEGTDYLRNHSRRFAASQSPAETASIKRKIDEEENDAKIMHAAGGLGALASMAAGTLSPTMLLPGRVAFGAAKAGVGFGRSALEVGAAMALQSGVQEAGLQSSQETRTLGESVLNVTTATILGSLLGGTAVSLLAREGHLSAVTAKLDRDRAEMAAHAAGEPLPAPPKVEGEAPSIIPPAAASDAAEIGSGRGLAASVGAAAADTRKLELVPTGFGLEKLGTDPMSRALNSPATVMRRLAVDLAEPVGRFKENLEGIATTQGPSLDRQARLAINQTRVAVGDTLDRLWKDLRFAGEDAPWFARARDALGTLDRPAGLPKFDEFKAMVSDAMRNGDVHDIPQVQEAAQFIRKTVFDPWKERAIKAGLLPEDVDVKTADSYLQRVYNKQAVAAKRPEFVNKVLDWLTADQETKVGAQDRLSWAHAQLRSWDGGIRKLEGRLETLDAARDRLAARFDERAQEVGRVETRVGALDERATLIAEELSEVQEFIGTMRQQARDPAMLARLDDMERELSQLRKADRPMSEAELRKVEQEELGGILTGPARMAAEMLTGRRAFPKAPSFVSWIVANGGLKDTGGDVSSILGGTRTRPGLINARGRQLDELAEKIQNEYPGAFPHKDEPGGGAPSHDQILGWIDSELRGQQPAWWIEAMSHEDKAKIEAGKFAATLDEAFTRAGIEVKNIRDVAKVFRDERTAPMSLNDLDRVTREMEAAGQDIPVSLRRAGAEETYTVGRAELQALRDVIDKARAARDAKAQRLRVAEARGEEAALAERANKGRLGILDERMDRADRRRELMVDMLELAGRERDTIRGKIEGEIAAWQGQSTREAKSALKARDKYAAETGRAADAPRLTSADSAVDAAVRRIVESPRDLDVHELRDRAHQITDRILGSPDGRLPYDEAMGGPIVGPPRGGGEPPRGPLAAREFNIPDAMISGFLENDIEHVMNAHLRTMVPDVLLTERFGDVAMSDAFRQIDEAYARLTDATKNQAERTALEKRRQSDIRDLAAMRDRIRGVYGLDTFNTMRGAARTAAAVKNYNVLTSMGMATVSSLPDMAGAAFRHGVITTFRDAYAPFLRYLMGMGDEWKEAARQFRAMGIANEMVVAQRHHALSDIMDSYRPQSRLERTLQVAADKFQFVNALAPWTDWGKINASMIASAEILRASEAVTKGAATKRQIAQLAESGIDGHLAERIWNEFSREGAGDVINGVHLPNTDRWESRAARDAFEGAIAREADIAIVTPGQEKPLWLSNPIISVLGQFKSFTAAATQRILIANLQRADAQTLQGLMFSLGLGMLSYKVNSLLGGQPTSERPADWVKEAISRGSLLGWFEEGNALASKMTRGGVDVYRLIGADKPLSRYAGRSVIDQMLGPTAGKIDALRHVTGAAGAREWGEADTKALRKLIAFQNVFWLRGAFNQVEAGANNAFGIEMKPPKPH